MSSRKILTQREQYPLSPTLIRADTERMLREAGPTGFEVRPIDPFDVSDEADHGAGLFPHGGQDPLASLAWRRGGEVAMISTHPEYQRQGLATQLFNHVKQHLEPGLHHSPHQTPEGAAWARQAATYYHHTDDPDFAPDPSRRPWDIMQHDEVSQDPGLWVSHSPTVWGDLGRKYRAEIDGPDLPETHPFETFVPGDRLHEFKVKGVTPHERTAAWRVAALEFSRGDIHPDYGPDPEHSVSAHLDGEPVGRLLWYPDGEITQIEVHPDHRRKGIGTQMFNWTKRNVQPRLRHSPVMTPEGASWAASMGHDPEDSDLVALDPKELMWPPRTSSLARVAASIADDDPHDHTASLERVADGTAMDPRMMTAMGARGNLPEDITFQHHPMGSPSFPDVIEPSAQVDPSAFPAVSAHVGDQMVGHIQWHGDHPRKKGEIWDIRVHPDFRRRGVADALYDWTTDQVEPDLHHSGNLSDDGAGWRANEEQRPITQQRYDAWSQGKPMPKRFASRTAFDPEFEDDDPYDHTGTLGRVAAAHPSTYDADHPLGQIASAHPNVDLHAWESPQGIKLNMIQVAPEHQRNGYAGAAMRDLTSYADSRGLPMALTPGIPEGRKGMSQSGLKRWYQSHGFVPNKGRNKDWNWAESMIRPGRTASLERVAGAYRQVSMPISVLKNYYVSDDSDFEDDDDGSHANYQQGIQDTLRDHGWDAFKNIPALEVGASGQHATLSDGNHRVRAADALGMTHAPVNLVTGEDDKWAAQYGRPVENGLRQHLGRTASLERVGGDEDYRMQHQAPGPETGFPVHNMTDGVPEDWYTHPHYYSSGETSKADTRNVAKLYNDMRGNPDHPVTIYRALPHGNDTFNTGDWVTPSLEYAKQHAIQDDDPVNDWPVIKTTVPAKHLWQNGDSYYEFGYHGPNVKQANLRVVR